MLDLARLMVFHWTRMNCSNSKWNTINNDILLDSSLALFQQFQKVEISSKYMHNNAALKNREFTLRDIILRIIFNSVSTVLITVTVSKIQQSKVNIWHISRGKNKHIIIKTKTFTFTRFYCVSSSALLSQSRWPRETWDSEEWWGFPNQGYFFTGTPLKS